MPPEDAVAVLQGVLDLVGGKVFAYRSADSASFAWVDVENWVSLWEPKVTGVAQHLAELYLDLGRTDRAIAVAQHALRVVPTDTGVTESLMRAYVAHGDHLVVKRVYEAHAGALDQLDLDEPAASTIQLYEQLRRRLTAG